jgi:hypothetical protein
MAGADEIRRYRIFRIVHVRGADRGMVRQGHAFAGENRTCWPPGGRFLHGRILFIREVAASVSA